MAFFRASFFLCTLSMLAACGGDDRTRGGDAGPGISCGTTTCTPGQVCCIDCDGTGLCGPPGTACAGAACAAPDAGSVDGGVPVTPIACGTTTCGAGEVCCIDCDGAGTCGPPGSACRGDACMPDGTPCGGTICAPGQICLTCCGADGPAQCSMLGSTCAGVICGNQCEPGTCRRGVDTACEEPTGPTGNGCCECGEDGQCASFCRCASPSTQVATPDGERPIATLRVGDLVYTVDAGSVVARPIVQVNRQPVSDHAVVRAHTSSGAIIEMSPRHPTADGRVFADLSAGELLGGVQIEAVELVPYEHDATYDVLPDSDTGFYFASGAVVGSTLAPPAFR